MTYNVFGGMLNLAESIINHRQGVLSFSTMTFHDFSMTKK